MNRRPSNPIARALTAVILGSVVISGGCSSTKDVSSAGDAATEAAAPGVSKPALTTKAMDAAGDSGSANSASGTPASLPLPTRSVVTTGTLDITSKVPTKAATEARLLVEKVGGRVANEESSLGGDTSVVLTLKIPPTELPGVVRGLAKLGKETARSQHSDDVTSQVVDLDARITVARKSVERVRAFLDQTKNVNELAGVEAELTRRETDLETLIGQQRSISSQVDMATLTLTIREPSEVITAKHQKTFLESVPGFGGALNSGFNALRGAVAVALAAVGYSLPFVLPALILLGIVRWIRRRRVGPVEVAA